MIKNCAQCGSNFELTEEYLKSLEKFTTVIGEKKYPMPAPELCPDCRQINRLLFRNEKNLYFRKCDFCGKSNLSWYHPDAKVKAYCPECYWSDKWDGTSCGKEFDFSRSFFDQFEEICREAPKMSRLAKDLENAEYVTLSAYCKDCYMLIASEYDEGCMYGRQVINSKNCVDILECFDSEKCYESMDVHKCYGVFYSSNCMNCSESMFLYGCRGCSDCLFCSNLRNKNFHVFNKLVSKEEYKKLRNNIFELLNSGRFSELQTRYENMCLESIHKNFEGQNNENSVGNFLTDCKNCINCFDLSNAEDCTFVLTGFNVKDLTDVCHTTDVELGYQILSFGYKSYNSKFGCGSFTSSNLHYFYEMHNCSDCFGCSGLIRKKYCILNKQYTKEEYEILVPKIIEHMGGIPASARRERETEERTGLVGSRPNEVEPKNKEWGKFLPVSFAPFGYNESHVFEYFPLSKEEALSRGFKWRDKDEREFKPSNYALPNDIKSVDDSLLDHILACESCGRNYKIMPAELSFYRKNHLPAPKKCFYCRHENRMGKRPKRKIFERDCGKCGVHMKTSYPPDYKGIVYCESCYLKDIY